MKRLREVQLKEQKSKERTLHFCMKLFSSKSSRHTFNPSVIRISYDASLNQVLYKYFFCSQVPSTCHNLIAMQSVTFLRALILTSIYSFIYVIWVKLFKNGPSKICGRHPSKNLKCTSNFFKGCLPQILFGPFLNTLTHISFYGSW